MALESNLDVQAEIAELESAILADVAEAFPMMVVSGVMEIETDDDNDIICIIIANSGQLYQCVIGDDRNPILQRVTNDVTEDTEPEEPDGGDEAKEGAEDAKV